MRWLVAIALTVIAGLGVSKSGWAGSALSEADMSDQDKCEEISDPEERIQCIVDRNMRGNGGKGIVTKQPPGVLAAPPQ